MEGYNHEGKTSEHNIAIVKIMTKQKQRRRENLKFKNLLYHVNVNVRVMYNEYSIYLLHRYLVPWAHKYTRMYRHLFCFALRASIC